MTETTGTPGTTDAATPVTDLSYEQARDELVALVSRIESGKVPLEEAMVLWERGEQLASHCQDKLDAAQESLERATGTPEAGAGGAPPATDAGRGGPSTPGADDAGPES